MSSDLGTYFVSYADTDAGGVLHHAKYIEFAERGRHSWLKARNISFRNLNRKHSISLVIYDIAAKYKSPVFLEDEIQVVTRLTEIDKKGLEWTTSITKDDNLSFSMLTKMVCLNSETKSIVSVPDFLIAKFTIEAEIA